MFPVSTHTTLNECNDKASLTVRKKTVCIIIDVFFFKSKIRTLFISFVAVNLIIMRPIIFVYINNSHDINTGRCHCYLNIGNALSEVVQSKTVCKLVL